MSTDNKERTACFCGQGGGSVHGTTVTGRRDDRTPPPRRAIIEFLQPFLVHNSHAHPCSPPGWLQGWLRSPCWGPFISCMRRLVGVNSSQPNIPTSGTVRAVVPRSRISRRPCCATVVQDYRRNLFLQTRRQRFAYDHSTEVGRRLSRLNLAGRRVSRSREAGPWCGTWTARTRRRKDADQMAFPPAHRWRHCLQLLPKKVKSDKTSLSIEHGGGSRKYVATPHRRGPDQM